MSGLSFWSCVRFSLQLMMSGAALTFYLPRRQHFLWRFLLGEAGYFIVVFGIFHGLQLIFQDMLAGQVLYYLLIFLVGVELVHLCFDVSEKELVFIGTGAYAIQHLTFNLVQLIDFIPVVGGVLKETMIWESGIPYAVMPAVIYFLLLRKYRETGELKEKDIRMIILSFVTIFTAIVVSLIARRAWDGSAQAFVCYLYGLICCCLSLFILMYIPKENRLCHEQQTLEQIIQVMGEQQQVSKESVEIINRKCHDIKHQLKALMEIEDKEQRRKYTEEIRQAISIYDAIYQTGNAALDFVLREKALRCQEYEIKLSCLTDGKVLGFINTLDIYALFGNILDNAIESVTKEPDIEKRIINLHVLRRADILHIHADNYCNEEIRFEDGLPLTNKKDKAYHGFGVRSIRHVTEKYGGEMVLKKENDRFVLDLLIPIPESEDVQEINTFSP